MRTAPAYRGTGPAGDTGPCTARDRAVSVAGRARVSLAFIAREGSMERYHLIRSVDNEGYDLQVHEVEQFDPSLISELGELDLLTYSEPTFSRFTLGGFLRHGRVYTITADGLIIGACHCLRDFTDPDEVVIFNMALRPGWRGHGLGTRFLYRILEKLQARGVRRVSLLVSTNNHRAIAVYRTKFGFEQVGVQADPYDTGHPYLAMRMDLGKPLPDVLSGLAEA